MARERAAGDHQAEQVKVLSSEVEEEAYRSGEMKSPVDDLWSFGSESKVAGFQRWSLYLQKSVEGGWTDHGIGVIAMTILYLSLRI